MGGGAGGGAAVVTPATALELQLVVGAGNTVLVDFYATWCGPCQWLTPELQKAAQVLGDRVKVMKVDTDMEPDLATELNIEGLPSLLLFRGGSMKPFWRIEGAMPSEEIVRLVGQALEK